MSFDAGPITRTFGYSAREDYAETRKTRRHGGWGIYLVWFDMLSYHTTRVARGLSRDAQYKSVAGFGRKIWGEKKRLKGERKEGKKGGRTGYRRGAR